MAEDINYYELFGVDEPTGAEEQETAEPVKDSSEEGAKEQETAETAVDEGTDNDDNAEAPEGKGYQDEQDNAKFAEMRRKAEAKARKELDAEIALMGLKDDDGNTIKTMDEYREHNSKKVKEKKAEEDADMRDRLADAGFTEDEAEQIIKGREATDRLARLEQKLTDIENEKRQTAFQTKVREELDIISEYDPSIKTIEDLKKMDNYDKFSQYVSEGDSFLTAYMRTHRGRGRSVATGDTKSHLKSTQTRGSGGIDVPESVIANYRVFNPKASRKEIIEHYRRTHK